MTCGSSRPTSSSRAWSARSPDRLHQRSGRGLSSPSPQPGLSSASKGAQSVAVTTTEPGAGAPDLPATGEFIARLARSAEAVIIPLFAILVAAILFSLFLLVLGKSPVEFFPLLWVGGFGTPF